MDVMQEDFYLCYLLSCHCYAVSYHRDAAGEKLLALNSAKYVWLVYAIQLPMSRHALTSL